MLNYRMFIKLARPLQILLSALTYSLGAGISRYLGHPVHAAAFGLGLLSVVAIEVAAFWLLEYFRLALTPLAKEESPRQREELRISLFQSAMALLTVAGASIVTLLLARLLPVPAGALMVLIVVFFIAYSVPPMRLAETGYGELAFALPWVHFFLLWRSCSNTGSSTGC